MILKKGPQAISKTGFHKPQWNDDLWVYDYTNSTHHSSIPIVLTFSFHPYFIVFSSGIAPRSLLQSGSCSPASQRWFAAQRIHAECWGSAYYVSLIVPKELGFYLEFMFCKMILLIDWKEYKQSKINLELFHLFKCTVLLNIDNVVFHVFEVN